MRPLAARLLLACLVAQPERAAASDCATSSAARCTVVETLGTWDGDTYLPDSGCYLAVPTANGAGAGQSETLELLAGQWFLMAGGSNMRMIFEGWLNSLFFHYGHDPYAADETKWGDWVFERSASDGSWAVLWHATYAASETSSYDPTGAGGGDADYAVLLPMAVDAGATHAADRVRLTFLHTVYWPSMEGLATAPPGAGGGWAGAPRVVQVQTGTHYAPWSWNAIPADGWTTADFQAGLDSYVAATLPMCSEATTTCFVLLISCQNEEAPLIWTSARCTDEEYEMNDALKLASAPPPYRRLRLRLRTLELAPSAPTALPHSPTPVLPARPSPSPSTPSTCRSFGAQSRPTTRRTTWSTWSSSCRLVRR